MVAVGAAWLSASPVAHASGAPRTEVVVALAAPSLADSVQESRVLTARAKATRLDLESPSSTWYLSGLKATQDALARRIERTIPSATVRWRYRIVLDGLAVEPADERPARALAYPGRHGGLPGHEVPPEARQARPEPGADRRRPALGPAGLHVRGERHQDRDHRRGSRPGASLLQSGRLRLSGRVPEGQHRVHDAEGDRRPRVPASRRDVEVREHAVRPGQLRPRHARGRHRGRRLQRQRGRRARAAVRRRPSRVHRQLQGADRTDARSSGSTATHPRSRRRSRLRSRTAWT